MCELISSSYFTDEEVEAQRDLVTCPLPTVTIVLRWSILSEKLRTANEMRWSGDRKGTHWHTIVRQRPHRASPTTSFTLSIPHTHLPGLGQIRGQCQLPISPHYYSWADSLALADECSFIQAQGSLPPWLRNGIRKSGRLETWVPFPVSSPFLQECPKEREPYSRSLSHATP
jgi:hypothetical protein